MKINFKNIVLGTLLWGLSGLIPAWGQPVSPQAESGQKLEAQGGPREGISSNARREKVRKRVEMMRMLRMTEELEMDEEAATRFFSRLRPLEKERWKLIKDRKKMQRQLKKVSRSEKSNPGEIKDLIQSMEENEAGISVLAGKEKAVVKSLLTPRQQAKYMLFKDHFRNEMKERVQKARKARSSKRPAMRQDKGTPSP